MKRRDIRQLSQEQLKDAVVAMGEKPFRTKQLAEWIWTKSAGSFEEMSNLSKGFRAKLEEEFELNRIEPLRPTDQPGRHHQMRV